MPRLHVIAMKNAVIAHWFAMTAFFVAMTAYLYKQRFVDLLIETDMRLQKNQVEKARKRLMPPSFPSGINRFDFMVDLKGFEPSTPTMRMWCAPSCATSPFLWGAKQL